MIVSDDSVRDPGPAPKGIADSSTSDEMVNSPAPKSAVKPSPPKPSVKGKKGAVNTKKAVKPVSAKTKAPAKGK